MNPSITQGPFTKTAWRGDPSESILKRYFDGVPVNPDQPDNPDPPPVDPGPTPSDLWFKGGFTLMKGEQELGEFILVPKPNV